MPVIFEFDKWVGVSDPESLKNHLEFVWHHQYRDLISSSVEIENSLSETGQIPSKQPFLQFEGNQVRARNFVGFIQQDDLHLELYPKVFKNHTLNATLILRHIFHWFDYCRKWKFPFSKTNLDKMEDVDFPELIIYLMASKMLDTVSSLPISLYQNIEETLQSPKGKISFSRYLAKGFINGNHHMVDCDYQTFVFDNRLNQIIKYTARLLLTKTKLPENQGILQELLFILDDVSDYVCNYYDLDTLVLNPLFAEYEEVKNICQIILQQLLYSNEQYDLSQWSLLFPMEYIFEDFIAGFLQDKFSGDWKIEYQKSNLNLSTNPVAFQMQHDIFLTSRKNPSKSIIVDAKYKIRNSDFKMDKKKGIAQVDMYQMVSYAFRRGCSNVLLLYPNTEVTINTHDSFTIDSGFPDGQNKINLVASEIPFWSIDGFDHLSMQLTSVLKRLLTNFD